MELDEKALEAATEAVCLSDHLSAKAITASGEREAILRHARKHANAAIAAYLSALRAGSETDDFVLVPKEPTEAMAFAVGIVTPSEAAKVWRAMLSAAGGENA